MEQLRIYQNTRYATSGAFRHAPCAGRLDRSAARHPSAEHRCAGASTLAAGASTASTLTVGALAPEPHGQREVEHGARPLAPPRRRHPPSRPAAPGGGAPAATGARLMSGHHTLQRHYRPLGGQKWGDKMGRTEVCSGGVDKKAVGWTEMQWMAPPKGSPADGAEICGCHGMCRFLRLRIASPPRKAPAHWTSGPGTWIGGVGRTRTWGGMRIGSRCTVGARGRRSRASSVCRTRARATWRCGWRSATRSAKGRPGRYEHVTKGNKGDEQIDRGCLEWASGGRRLCRRRGWVTSSLVGTGLLNRAKPDALSRPPPESPTEKIRQGRRNADRQIEAR